MTLVKTLKPKKMTVIPLTQTKRILTTMMKVIPILSVNLTTRVKIRKIVTRRSRKKIKSESQSSTLLASTSASS